ncbi:MAG: decarboxylase [Candidatus Aenigmarchaeota archaeon]|nr:decarboxylase [Candidatus Aenigmarchaeota archaeon]
MTKSRFIVSKSKLLSQYKILKDLGLDISYSLKTLPEIAHILEDNTESFFSIHMMESLHFIKDKSRIWFLAQAWNNDRLNEILKMGIRNFVVDNEKDLETLINYIDKINIKINLLLRMKLKEYTIHTGKYFVFGMSSDEINDLIPKLRNNKKIDKLGIHFHRKTQNTSEWSLKEELSQLLKKETIEKINVVNIGGGIPIEYKNSSDRNAKFIFEKIVELKNWLMDNYGIKTIIEPGRFLAGPSTKLETEILTIYDNNIVVDASIYNGALDTLLIPTKLLVEDELEEGKQFVIKGCTPCSMDIFRYDVKLKNPKIGNKIVFLNAGAYNFSTDFCNLQKLDVVIIK